MGKYNKITYEYAYDYIKSKGCLLISDKVEHGKQEILVKCKCGNIYKCDFSRFKNNNKIQCNQCTYKDISKRMKMNYEEVKKYVESKGCKLISEDYKRNNQKLLIQCSCGNLFERTLNKFKQTSKCLKCVKGLGKYDYYHIRNFIEEESESGCKLISKSYENRNQKLKIKCKCGNIFYANLSSFLHGGKRHCKECAMIGFREKKRKGIEYYKRLVEEISDSELLSDDYIDASSDLLKFKCSCGNIFYASLSNFKSGKYYCNFCTSNVSKMEIETERFLQNKNINYKYQYGFEDLKGTKGSKLLFDFAIFNDKNKIYCLIELDGKQHFEPVDFFSGEESFLKLKEHDRRKNNYCHNNKLYLVRIPYYEKHNLDFILEKKLKSLCK